MGKEDERGDELKIIQVRPRFSNTRQIWQCQARLSRSLVVLAVDKGQLVSWNWLVPQ